MGDGRRNKRVWPVDQEQTVETLRKEADLGAGEWIKRGNVTTINDLPPSREEDNGEVSGSYHPHLDAPLQERDKLRRANTDRHHRHHSISASSRPLDNGYTSAGHASSAPRPRWSSVDDTERKSALPYDTRHMFHDVIPERRVRSEAEKRLSICMKEKKHISERLIQTEEKLEGSNRKNEELEAEVQRLADDLAALKDMFRDSESRRRKTARLLQETAAELHGVNYYLTKTDALSDTDVVDVVDKLNAEIMQTSALMADDLEKIAREKEPEGIANTNERLFNRRALGDAMIHYLEADGQVDSMAIQLALQFCIAETCYVVVESWQPGDWRGDVVFNNVYASLKRTVIQPVFGRWRALTRSQTNYEDSQAAVYSYLRRRVKDVLSLAGWPGHIRANRDFLGTFKDRIELIVTLSLRLHRASSEDVTSGELRAKMVYPNEAFDTGSMDEAFPDEMNLNSSESQLRSVSGTTDLGLVRTVGAESRTLRKPKVVLLSALHTLLDG
ncbi:hypothetical protein C0991_007178 [Blastosporella zonata]|nr:hypothetical protein C0991_007178 [Blastosporella zonata]